jgi:hypothetical protein
MPRAKIKTFKTGRVNIYVKPMDKELFLWALSQRQSLSEVIALALMDYKKKLENENHS